MNSVFQEIDLSSISSGASADAFQWLCDANDLIDQNMGNGYAKKHPELIAGFMLTCVISYHAERQVDAAEMIARALLKLAETRGDHG